jgi:hypothetical protein
MIHRGVDWWDVGRQGSCGLYLTADCGSQGRSWLKSKGSNTEV